VQAHYTHPDATLTEGGQLLLLEAPSKGNDNHDDNDENENDEQDDD
jgi:hypothetical protein